MSFRIASRSVPTLEVLADLANVDCATYIAQSVILGLALATIALEVEDSEAFILFEQPDGEYDKRLIDFSPQPSTEVSSEVLKFEEEFDTNPDGFDVNLDPVTQREVEDRAARLLTTCAAFLEASIEYRYLWAQARSVGRTILLHDGDPEGMLAIEGDPF